MEPLSGKNLGTLKFGEWLNDEVINAYVRLINNFMIERKLQVRCMNTFFFRELTPGKIDLSKIKRIFKRQNIELENIEKLYLPLNKTNSHWSFLSLDMTKKVLYIHDSISPGIDSTVIQISKNLGKIFETDIKVSIDKDFPVQHNGHDCGVF